MGAEGYSSAGSTQLSAKVDEKLKRDFKQACEDVGVTMTDAIEDQMAAFVGEHAGHVIGSGGERYPSESRLRTLYEACLRHAGEDFIIHQRHDARAIAEETGVTSKDDLAADLVPLRRQGYVALGPMPVGLQSSAAKRWRWWYIKPPEADPGQWTRRENM